MREISEIASKLGLGKDEYEPYGRTMAKVSLSALSRREGRKRGKLILVTAINPTPAGEGKTTTSIGLSQAFQKLGKNVAVALREPSLGPCFGIKGGATGGGKSTVEPSDRINLLFTSDFPAVSAAHNLLSALINNHIHHGNPLNIDPKKILFPRTIDMNDRSLREIIVGVGGRDTGAITNDKFVITPASEIMAILGLSQSYSDLKERLSKILVGYSTDNKPVFAGDLKAAGAMAALLRDALRPNLVQTQEGVPAFVHTGPFGNIAHGTSSILADKLGLKLTDYLITEAGFGSELGAEKFMNLASKIGNLPVDAVVVVATIRALKHHGRAEDINQENVEALESGSENLIRHVQNMRQFGFEPVVAINRFPKDTENEIKALIEILQKNSIKFALSEVFAKGGDGGIDLAKEVIGSIPEKDIQIKRTYNDDDDIKEKIEKIATEIYGASGVIYEKGALKDIRNLKKVGMEEAPVCLAKTQYSFSDDPTLLNAPKDFRIKVTSVSISSGAGFVVPLLGSVMTMPGLPTHPSAEGIDVDENGEITGLF
ncbi:formate--tetrahydrofolate ligase [uncultured archaeon]|nr:formate--tetrahydrofolate ligase [uncultured archaeon]